jgi:hypothetical protein
MQQKTLGIFCSVGLVVLVSGMAQAQNSAGALQLALGTEVITYNSSNVTWDAYPVQAQGNYKINQSGVHWGFNNHSSVNIEGGYGLGDSLVLGGFIGLGGWSQKNELPRGNELWRKDSTLDLLIAPKIDYMFLPGQSIRPFIGAALGLIYQSATVESRNGNVTTTDSDDSATGLAVMLRAGVRFFVTPGFSLDPAFTFLWIPTASGSHQEGDRKYDLGANGYTLGLTVAASGWVGL